MEQIHIQFAFLPIWGSLWCHLPRLPASAPLPGILVLLATFIVCQFFQNITKTSIYCQWAQRWQHCSTSSPLFLSLSPLLKGSLLHPLPANWVQLAPDPAPLCSRNCYFLQVHNLIVAQSVAEASVTTVTTICGAGEVNIRQDPLQELQNLKANCCWGIMAAFGNLQEMCD